jgi:CheY-like chemotaxis protein
MTRRILVVDQDSGGRAALRAVLEGDGYEVLDVACGRDALDAATRQRPDALVLDMHLPDIDGPVLLRALRNMPSLLGLPVLAMFTGRLAPDLGAVGLDKPVDGPRLLALLRRVLGS